MKLLDKIDRLNDEGIFMLLNPGLIETYDEETMVNLLNAYLEYNCSRTRVIRDGDSYYYNGLLIDVKDSLIYRVMEPLFLQVAKERIETIAKKDLKTLENKMEKDKESKNESDKK